jgi:hypothetical protein
VASSVFVTLQGWGASDTGESSLASATRARRKDSGRQEARGRNLLIESLRRAVQYSTEASIQAQSCQYGECSKRSGFAAG